MTTTKPNIEDLLKERILVLDGAMGTMIQRYSLTEEDFRGERFKDHPHPLKGNNDLLCITRPDIIESIHLQFLEAGANIIETCTFSSSRISQADYKMEHIVRELNIAGVKVARSAIDKFQKTNPDHPRLFPIVHAVHHRSHNPTPWAALAFHPLEAFAEIAVVPVVILWMPFHPLVLFAFS